MPNFGGVRSDFFKGIFLTFRGSWLKGWELKNSGGFDPFFVEKIFQENG